MQDPHPHGNCNPFCVGGMDIFWIQLDFDFFRKKSKPMQYVIDKWKSVITYLITLQWGKHFCPKTFLVLYDWKYVKDFS